MTIFLRGLVRGLACALLCCIVIPVAAGCGGDSPLPQTNASPESSHRPSTVKQPTIDRDRLPVRLRIPGTPDVPGTPIDASENDFGEYLHVVDLADGSATLVDRLQPAPDAYHLPLLSPDRARVAYPSRGSIAIVEIVTGASRTFPIPDYAPPAYPCIPPDMGLSWSPDGVRLAVNTNDRLLVLDTATGEYRRIVQDVGSCEVAWSPSGEWIAFASQRTLARIRPDGSDRFDGPEFYAFPDFMYASPRDFVWSRDSMRLFFSADKTINNWRETISFSSGLDLRASAMPIGDTIAWQSPPMSPNPSRDLPFIEALSMSGTRTAYFRSDHDENWKWTSFIETRDLDGKNSHTLVTRPETGASIAYALFWSPDDAFIAYPYRLPGNDGGSVRIVDPGSADDLPAVLSPDNIRLVNGRWVVCDVLVVGWLSTTSLMTWTTCEGSI